MEYLDRPGDVLDGLLPARLDFDRDLVAHLLRSTARYVDAAGVRQRLDPGGDIHPVTIDVVALDDNVTDIDANPELYPTSWLPALCSWTCFCSRSSSICAYITPSASLVRLSEQNATVNDNLTSGDIR